MSSVAAHRSAIVAHHWGLLLTQRAKKGKSLEDQQRWQSALEMYRKAVAQFVHVVDGEALAKEQGVWTDSDK